MKKLFYFFSLMLIFLTACDQDEVLEDENKTNETIDSLALQNELVNEWTYNYMSLYYYWEDELPNLSSVGNEDPIKFFKSLLNVNDHWSYMVDDYAALNAELDGIPKSMGYKPHFYRFKNRNVINVMILVEYVFPGSPAELAGLKRGDVILQIDGAYLTIDDYYEKYTQDAYTVSLGSIRQSDNNISLSGKEIDLMARVITADPTIYSTVFDTMGVQIGYMVYTDFVTGIENAYLETINDVVEEFNSAGIDELIVDLRYNGGGSPEAAGYLASAIAPIANVNNKDVLIHLKYNEGLTSYYAKNFGLNSDYFLYRFPENKHNLNLNRVHFLTSIGSASASELLMIALRPYMETVLVGDTTYGKFTGMYVMGDDAIRPAHNYGILPVVLKYENANGFTDFYDGLIPNIPLYDKLVDAPPFGDTKDEILSAAINNILNISSTQHLPAKQEFKEIVPKQIELKNNLIFRDTPK